VRPMPVRAARDSSWSRSENLTARTRTILNHIVGILL
jgi:hypothetical protein